MKKEWTGNSNSARYAVAAKKKGSTTERAADDFYATDPKALEMLLDKSSLWLRDVLNSFLLASDNGKYRVRRNGWRSRLAPEIWEPAAGTGNLCECLRERGYDVIGSDIKDRGYLKYKGMCSIDFLQTTQDFCWDYNVGAILTNPPYSLALEFANHALDVLPENGLYIALMNISYLSGKKRYEQLFQFGELREVYVFSKRIEYWKNNERPKDKCGSIVNYAWYVFQKGWCGNPTLYWI